MKSPSEELVEIISPLLVKNGWLLPEDSEKCNAKIAAGTMKPEDWLMAVEKALTKEGGQ